MVRGHHCSGKKRGGRLGATPIVNPGCDGHRPHLVFITIEDLSVLEHSVYGKFAVAEMGPT